MGISWRYNQLESSWVILVTNHPLGRNSRYDRPVVMAPGNGKIPHRNINSLIFLDFPLPYCTDAIIGWHHTSSIYIPNRQHTSPTIAWYYIPCWVATYLCRVLVGWFWIFLLIRGYSWKAKSLALSTLEGCYIKTYQHLEAAYSEFLSCHFGDFIGP